MKRKKPELIDLLLQMAADEERVRRCLTMKLEIALPPEALADATRKDIADATHFDVRDIHTNFDYDVDAYLEVKRNLQRFVKSGQFAAAMQLAIELMTPAATRLR